MAVYQTLGHYYDALVGDPEASDHWVEWIETFKPGNDFLELACGSGVITVELAQNHHVDALDLSAEMIEAARNRDTSGSVEFSICDMRDLSGYGLYDAVGCFCDSINYLEPEELSAFFGEVRSHLKPGGLFLFDSHSMNRLEEFSEEYEEAGEFDDGTQIQWIISAEEGKIYQDFAFYFDGQTVEEHHVQNVFSLDDLKHLLESDFEILSISGDFGDSPLDDCEKYFIACRAKAD